jgi:hypothetical protein
MFSWIIDHIIGSIPVWVWAFVAGGGAGAYFMSGFVSRIPVGQAKLMGLLSKYIGLAVFTAGVFMCGGAGVTSVMQDAIKEAQAKVDKAEAESKDANEKLAATIAAGKTHTKEVQYIIQDRIVKESAKMDAECKLDPEVVKILNDAATNTGGKK